MSTAIAEYSATDAALADMRGKYMGVVYEVAKPKHMQEAKEARAELRGLRISLEKKRTEIKAPALERCRQIDSEAKRITAELLGLESPIDEQIKAEEQRKEREKAAREQAEREARAIVQERFDTVKGLPLLAVGKSSDSIRALISSATEIDDDFPTEVLTSAFKFEHGVAIAALNEALSRQIDAEAEAVRIKAERAELTRLRAEQDAMRAEADRIAAAERDRQATEAKRLEAAARAERDAIEQAARTAREEEQRRIDAERAEARKIEDAERAAAAKKLLAQQKAAREEGARLDAEKKAIAKREKAQAIASATLHTAAAEAVSFLQSEGYAEHMVTLKLSAALSRESKQAQAA